MRSLPTSACHTGHVISARIRLGGLAVVSLVAGSLPWAMGGSLAARLLGVPFLLIGLLAGYVVLMLPRWLAAREQPTVAAYPAAPSGCACGGGGCCDGPASPRD